MKSKEQEQLIKERVKLVVEALFISNVNSINELANKLRIPSSTIQRDLNNKELINEIFGTKSNMNELISQKLQEFKLQGFSRGGINSTNNNEYLRDEYGHFSGVKK